jgi:hypothetical protein
MKTSSLKHFATNICGQTRITFSPTHGCMHLLVAVTTFEILSGFAALLLVFLLGLARLFCAE